MATKKTARVLAAIAATATLSTIAATPAAATIQSRSNCGFQTCVHVEGDGLRVNYLRGTVEGIDPTKNFYGFYRFFMGSWTSDSSTGRWWTYSDPAIATPPQIEWPDGTLACMVPMKQDTFGDGFHEWESPQCVELHR